MRVNVRAASMVLSCALLLALSPRGMAQTGGTEEGIDVVDVVKATATVEKIDLETRKVTLVFDTGKKKTLKVDKSVGNLDQVKVGDHLKLSYTEEMIILVGQTKEKAGAAGAEMVGVAPKGAKPGGVMVETSDLTAKVVSVDAQKHRVVLQEPDGKKKTVKLSKKVTNLDQLKPGESIDVIITDELAIEVTK